MTNRKSFCIAKSLLRMSSLPKPDIHQSISQERFQTNVNILGPALIVEEYRDLEILSWISEDH